ncbi:endo alpha-1,4 polygalactosaminidase [Sphingomonas adhaesiva]|uniref:endo alpha-1,4 polygalactosaminidase n=1 Tax=Sphingomonas adhaesiva TaxID=28212 RepID=UPI002FFD3DB0
MTGRHLTLVLLAALTACGASGGDDDTPAVVAPAPTPTPSPTPATTRWTPRLTDSWTWQLSGTIDTGVDAAIYDIDLFDTPTATIAALHAGGRRVLCYVSAGSSEDWRPDDARFAAGDRGRALDGWPGERWLDIRSTTVRTVIADRIRLAATRGCDGVEPDNVDGYDNATGFPLTAADQLAYNRFLATSAHAAGLAIALKNDVAQLADLAPDFDLAVNEQCHEFDECAGYRAFTDRGKPVLNAEYAAVWRTDAAARARLCATAAGEKLRTLVLPMQLDASFRYACP